MADEPISALTLLTSYSTADEVEILDVSDTTFASTGTNKRIQFSTLLTMAGGGGGSGTVTSVGLSLPSIIAVTGSPVSTSGTLTGTLATQTANTVFAGPSSGGVVAPTFRALVATDIPSLPASQITSGQISVAQGGTGLGTLTAHAVVLGEGTSSPGFATIGTAGRVLTDQGSGLDPVFLAIPNATVVTAVLGSSATLTTSMSNVGLSITLPSAGTYLLMGCVRVGLSVTGSIGQNGYIVAQFYDSTNSNSVPNSQVLPIIGYVPVASTQFSFQQSSPIGPVTYTVTKATVIQLRALYATNGTVTSPLVYSDSNGATSITAIRIY